MLCDCAKGVQHRNSADQIDTHRHQLGWLPREVAHCFPSEETDLLTGCLSHQRFYDLPQDGEETWHVDDKSPVQPFRPVRRDHT